MKEHMRQAEFSLKLIEYALDVVEQAWASMLKNEGVPDDHTLHVEYAHYVWDDLGEEIIDIVTTKDKTEDSEIERRRVTWVTND